MDSNTPYIIIDGVADRRNENHMEKLLGIIDVDEDVNKYERLLHYTNLESFSYILGDKTIKCTCINSTNLNDKYEAKRKGIEQYNGSRFITCFSHCPYELVPFWMNYGGNYNEKKLLLRFKNFSSALEKVIHLDYCITDAKKKMFFPSSEMQRTINYNGLGELIGSPPINTDYDTRNFIRKIKLFDVSYLPISDDIFNKVNVSEVNLISTDGTEQMRMPLYETQVLGRYKTIHWDYEKETRILCVLNVQDIDYYDHLFLRVKDEIFRDLEIVINPWADDGLKEEIEEVIQTSSLDDEIKKSINVISSELLHQVK